jgi:cytochrome c5
MRLRALGAWLCAGAVATAILFGGSAPALAKSPRKKAAPKPLPADFDVRLPVLGTQLAEFPPGRGKAVADQGCLLCHSASMVAQQRLTEKQWAKELDKMIGWGAAVPADKRDELLAYLIANFGPDNDRFEPRVTRPVGK